MKKMLILPLVLLAGACRSTVPLAEDPAAARTAPEPVAVVADSEAPLPPLDNLTLE